MLQNILPFELDAQLFVSFHVVAVVLHVILGVVAYLILLERKLSAWIQDRVGPNRVGPFGFLQPIADGLKFILKEDYAPRGVDKFIFTLAPMTIVIPALVGWAIIPWGGYVDVNTITLPLVGTFEAQRVLIAAADINIGVVYLLAVASFGVYGVTLGGWASNNKFSFLGGLRCAAGMVSYEIPMGIAVLCVVLMAGVLTPQAIIEAQTRPLELGGGWFVLHQPLVMLLFLICMLAEANRAPFDNAEAEQELVGGYHTEYSAMRFALFFLAEYAHMITGAAFLILLFFGGYHLPFVAWTHPEAVGVGPAIAKSIVFLAKIVLTIGVTMWIRWTLPRIRWDQVMKLAWNGLVPLGIALLLGCAFLVYMGWTNMGPALLMNIGVGGGAVAVQALRPSRPGQVNKKVRMPGSRFYPTLGQEGAAAPTGSMARFEMAPDLRK